jgi:hypothetical protein
MQTLYDCSAQYAACRPALNLGSNRHAPSVNVQHSARRVGGSAGASDYGADVGGGTYPGGSAVGAKFDPGDGYAVPLGVAFSTGVPVVGASGIVPAVGSGEGGADGELTSHPTSSASVSSAATTMRNQYFIELPSVSTSDARHSSALPSDCQDRAIAYLPNPSKQHYISNVALRG